MTGQFQIQLSSEFPTSAENLYTAWLSGEEHSKFTGAAAVIDARNGGLFTAWDEYINGTTEELEPYKRILQRWRTTEFADTDEDSFLELTFEPTDGGCKLWLKHWNIPSDQVTQYTSGWVDHYFIPMKDYFSS